MVIKRTVKGGVGIVVMDGGVGFRNFVYSLVATYRSVAPYPVKFHFKVHCKTIVGGSEGPDHGAVGLGDLPCEHCINSELAVGEDEGGVEAVGGMETMESLQHSA